MKRRNLPLGAILAAVFVIGFFGITHGQSADGLLKNEVDQLKRDVAALSSRVSILEKRLRPGGQSVPVSLVAWRKLNTRLSQSDVRGILGEPKRIDARSYTGTITWYYGSEERDSYVTFNIKTGLVTGWAEPK